MTTVLKHIVSDSQMASSSYVIQKPYVIYKPIVKASFSRCSLEDRILFPNSTCLLTISVGAKAHEDEKFMATIKLINRSFKSCHLLIGDTLHRHTLKIDYPDGDDSSLYNISRNIGDLWIKRNEPIYKQLTIPYKIIRWDEYLQHKLFQEKLDKVNALYDTDQSYRDAFKLNIEQYFARYINRKQTTLFNNALAFSYCLQYLKEECASMCLWTEGAYNVEVYPSSRAVAMDITYKKLIQPFYPDLLKFVSLRFKK